MEDLEFNCDILLRTFVNVTIYPQHNNIIKNVVICSMLEKNMNCERTKFKP
jgi:hypothetical protein